MNAAGPAAQDLRGRAIRLLEEDFRLRVDFRERRTVCEAAFGDVRPSALDYVGYQGSLSVFVADVVDRLLADGCMARGEHGLSRLIRHLASLRVRAANPDYYDLPLVLDSKCTLPTRQEEQAYLDGLLIAAERYVCLYSPMAGLVQPVPEAPVVNAFRDLWDDTFELVSMRYEPLHPAAKLSAPLPESSSNLLKAFAKLRQAVVLGEPGSGKSTMLWKHAAELARDAKNDSHRPIPLLARLGDWTGDESLTAFLAASVAEIGWAAGALASSGRLVLLLDGLNEVPTGKRKDKAAEVRNLLASFPRVFVSCREEDHAGNLALPLDKLTLQPLTPARIRAAVRHWVESKQQPVEFAETFFWQLSGDPGLEGDIKDWLGRGKNEDAFWAEGSDWRLREYDADPRRLLKLAANPFLLTMLFRVWAEGGGVLPPNRGELFQDFIYHLLKREGLAPAGILDDAGERLLGGLSRLAWEMQTTRAKEGGDFGVLTVVSYGAAERILGDGSLLKFALDSTLLEGSEELRFRHQLLQEYFTARALHDKMPVMKAVELWAPERWWERNGWEETAVLLAGFGREDSSPVIRWLQDAQPEVAAQCILESGAKFADESKLRREMHAAWMPRLLEEADPKARAALGRALGRLDLDDRSGVGLTKEGLPDIDWVRIDGGQFMYGEEKECRRIMSFAVSRYPVTNAQYRAFLEAVDGYGADCWWVGFDHTERSPREPRWNESNHPRELVTWFEASAFCLWLSEKLGFSVELPTEDQWERAARGNKGRAYPWGEKFLSGHANLNEILSEVGPNYVGRTSAVGIYPEGATAEGVMDLSGNVWEWCQDKYYPGTKPRVLRGGAWYDSLQHSRADFRDSNPMDDGNYGIGFRLVCSSPCSPLPTGPLNTGR